MMHGIHQRFGVQKPTQSPEEIQSLIPNYSGDMSTVSNPITHFVISDRATYGFVLTCLLLGSTVITPTVILPALGQDFNNLCVYSITVAIIDVTLGVYLYVN